MDELNDKVHAIRQYMDYCVPAEQLEEAADLLELYRDDQLGLALLHEFYSNLPAAEECWVREIRLIRRNRGIFLLAAVTAEAAYLYLVSNEGIEFHGQLAEGLWDRDLLDFFAVDAASGLEAADLEFYPIYEPLACDPDICPACRAATGEYHELGCPVEVCPWCGGQFIHCSCRFDQLEQDFLGEEDLDQLEALLEERGRIPYAPEQRPSFPSLPSE